MNAIPLKPRKFLLTPKQVLGPYFIADAPMRKKLFPSTAKGENLRIAGSVVTADGKTIPGAVIHVWLADPQGRYDNQDDAGNTIVIPPALQRFRGRITANASGNYAFECLRPGNYFDDGYKLWRPAHIHVLVEAPGFEKLTTQLYFPDDAHNHKDIPGDDFFQPELVVTLSPAVGGPQNGIFNFVLKQVKTV